MFARELGVQKVVIPQKEIASTWCAFGAASADLLHVYEQVDIQASPFDGERLNSILKDLRAKADKQLALDNIAPKRRHFSFSLDIRHKGQINEVEVMLDEGRLKPGFQEPLRRRFYARYEQLYGRGSSYRDARLEVVTLRLRATADTPRPGLKVARRLTSSLNRLSRKGARKVYWPESKKVLATPIFDGAHLVPGNRIKGPAVVETTDTTVAVHPGCTLRVDPFGNFEIVFL